MEEYVPRRRKNFLEREREAIAKANERWLNRTAPKTNVAKRNDWKFGPGPKYRHDI